jgi:hypothetical protein
MKTDEYALLTKDEVRARALKCLDENLDFVTLKPLQPGVGISTLFQEEAEVYVQTVYVPEQL